MLKYFIYSSIIVMFFLTIKYAFKVVIDNEKNYFTFLKKIYFTNFIVYLYSIIIFSIIFIIIITIGINYNYMPFFLKWSYLSLLNDQPTNLVSNSIIEIDGVTPSNYKIIILFIIWIITLLLLPILAYNEEVTFRSYNTNNKDILKSSSIFALIHIPFGIPIYTLVILFILGIFFSLLYRKKYLNQKFDEKNLEYDVENANKIATIHVSQVHTLYNLIIFSILIFYLMGK